MTSELDVREAYARGRAAFMGIDLLVAPGVLVPRPETELLGYTALELLRQTAEPSVIDLCCGTGNLACAIAHHIPAARVWASDLTCACVDLTRRNVALHALEDRVTVYEGDLLEPLREAGQDGRIDAVVCNPPYISDRRLAGDRSVLLEHEPREAFAAGPYGLDIHVRVVRDALSFLRPGGALLFEVGMGQDRQVKILFDRTRAYSDVRIVQDDAGEGRVVLGRKI